jgi:hypothetical protein
MTVANRNAGAYFGRTNKDGLNFELDACLITLNVHYAVDVASDGDEEHSCFQRDDAGVACFVLASPL